MAIPLRASKSAAIALLVALVFLCGPGCPQLCPVFPEACPPDNHAVDAGPLPGDANPTADPTDPSGGHTIPPPILKLPFPNGELWKVTQAYNTNSHVGLDTYALDFSLNGCDAYGRSIVAAAAGTVTWAVVQNVVGQCGTGGYGTNVIIDHGGGFTSRYCHLSALSVNVGDQIAQGQEIGRCGNTGCTVGTACPAHPGTHLHFAMQQKQNGVVSPYRPEPMSGYSGFRVGQWCTSDNGMAPPPPGPTGPLGIDVSHHNGAVDWTQVRNAGKTFAFVKATGGTAFVDDQFVSNAQNGRIAGVAIGAYHFAYPQYYTAHDEAQHFLSVAGPYIISGSLRPALDIEDDSANASYPYQMGKTALSTWIQSWASEVAQATGVQPVLYSTRWYVRGYADTYLTSLPLWVVTDSGEPIDP